MTGKIEKYEVMERDTRERLMFDMEALLRLEDGWEPVGGIAVDYTLVTLSGGRMGQTSIQRVYLEKCYLQAVIKRS